MLWWKPREDSEPTYLVWSSGFGWGCNPVGEWWYIYCWSPESDRIRRVTAGCTGRTEGEKNMRIKSEVQWEIGGSSDGHSGSHIILVSVDLTFCLPHSIYKSLNVYCAQDSVPGPGESDLPTWFPHSSLQNKLSLSIFLAWPCYNRNDSTRVLLLSEEMTLEWVKARQEKTHVIFKNGVFLWKWSQSGISEVMFV